tara:strand:- start:34397 stop:35140 length:744 start_codon:yes stop_codon:yes gene_type:complete
VIYTIRVSLAEKYYSFSSYAYVMNNPLTYIDPTGMSAESVQDDYTFDENTGTFTLVPDTESDTDRVVTLNDDGTTDKVLEKGIAKGFIHPKRNFKTKNNPYNVNGDGEPSLADFDHFQEVMSRLTKVESSSFGLGFETIHNDKKGNEIVEQNIQAVRLNKYEGNTDIEATSFVKTKYDTERISKGGELLVLNYLTATHTHRISSKHRAGTNDVWGPSEIDRKASRKQTGLIQYIISGGYKQKFKISD